jgi:hypothetical protein
MRAWPVVLSSLCACGAQDLTPPPTPPMDQAAPEDDLAIPLDLSTVRDLTVRVQEDLTLPTLGDLAWTFGDLSAGGQLILHEYACPAGVNNYRCYTPYPVGGF